MKKIYSLFFLVLFFLSIPSIAFAQTSLKNNECLYRNYGTTTVTLDCIPVLFGNLIYWLIIFAAIVAVFLIIIGGIKLLISSGDPGKVDGAKKTITWSILGLIVVISSFMIVNIIADITGVGCTSGFAKFGFRTCQTNKNPPPNNNNCPGGCPNDQTCKPVENGYSCRYICGARQGKVNGWCSGDKKCTWLKINEYDCRNHCGDRQGKVKGWCSGNKKCTWKAGIREYVCQKP